MPVATDPAPRARRARLSALPRPARFAAVAALVLGVLLLVLATLPVAPFRHLAERRLTAALGRRVTIGSIVRIDRVSLAPRLRLTGVRIAQPAWAGRGDMVVLRETVVRVPVLPALVGRMRPSLLAMNGAQLALVHDAGMRANWQRDPNAPRKPDSTPPDLTTVILTDVRFTLRDARRKLAMAGTVSSNSQGVRMRATGTHRGTPAQAALTGVPVLGGTAGKPWPFRAAFASPLARLTLSANADRPLDFSRFAGDATADGDDLKHIDDILLIGLIATQPVRASARLKRTGDRWALTQARAVVGRSDLAGTVTVDRADGRTKVAATIRSRAFGFADLANAEGRARSAALAARLGPRVIPDTRIGLAKLRTVDGRLDFRTARLLSETSSIFRALTATVVLDHARLTVSPLSFALTHGRLEGSATVAHPADRAQPHLALDLRLVGGRLEDVVTTGQVAGPLRGRARLAGDGATLRAALGRSAGSVALASRGGAITKSAAELLGRNLGAAFGLMIADSDSRTPLRCFAARFVGRGGRLSPDLFAIDTGVMRATGRGGVNLADESVAMILDGRSKHPGLVRLPAPIEVRGTLSHPAIETTDAGIGSAKTVLKALGQAIGRLFHGAGPPAPDMDCGALMAQAGV